MIEFRYLQTGLTGMAQAHRANTMAGHLGAAVVAGVFFCEDHPDLPPEVARGYVSRIGRESPWAQYAMLRPERLGPLLCPVLVVGAEDDRLVAAADVERCARALGTQPLWVPGGHDVMLDGSCPDVLDTILDWVDATCPPGPPLSGARELPPLEVTFE